MYPSLSGDLFIAQTVGDGGGEEIAMRVVMRLKHAAVSIEATTSC